MERNEAIEWLHKHLAWERWLTELHRHDHEPEVRSLEQQRRRRLPTLLTAEWWNRRSA